MSRVKNGMWEYLEASFYSDEYLQKESMDEQAAQAEIEYQQQEAQEAARAWAGFMALAAAQHMPF